MDAFLALRDLVREKAGKAEGGSYRVPAFLLGHAGSTSVLDAGDPYLFYADVCEQILRIASERPDRASAIGLSEQDVVYLSFIRSSPRWTIASAPRSARSHSFPSYAASSGRASLSRCQRV